MIFQQYKHRTTAILVYGTFIVPIKTLQGLTKDLYNILRYGKRATKKIKKPKLRVKREKLNKDAV